jgi:CubicO group peptidase (beta-lactamase class C family)
MTDLSARLAAKVDERFATFAAGGDDGPPAPGVVWGVVVAGHLVHSGATGTLRDGEAATPGPDSAFRIASMTKSFVSSAVLMLRDEGRLGLDDPIARHVPELAGLAGLTDDAPAITVRSLLSMGSGLPTDDPWADRLEDLADADFSVLLAGPKSAAWVPGVAYEYSNFGFAMLGRLVTNVSGTPFHAYVAERILGPLGLSSTAFSDDGLPREAVANGHHRVDDRWEIQPVQRPGAFSAIGGLYSSVRDIAVWMAGFCDAWPPRSGPGAPHPLSRATRREMQQVATTIPPFLHRDHGGRLRAIAGGYCLGLVSEEDVVNGRTISHSGGYPGFGSHMRWHPATGIGVVALANGRYAETWEPARDVLELLVAERVAPRPPIAPATALECARSEVERLLEQWDDGVAARFADNVDLDDPLPRRRAAVEELRETHGRLRRDGDLECDTPLRGRWWLAGERGGRVEAEIWLTAEVPPRLERLALTSVPEPTPELAAAAAAAVAALNAGRPVPAGLDFGDDATFDQAAVLLAPCELCYPLRGDGRTRATFLAESPAGPFELEVLLADARSTVANVAITPRARPPVLR